MKYWVLMCLTFNLVNCYVEKPIVEFKCSINQVESESGECLPSCLSRDDVCNPDQLCIQGYCVDKNPAECQSSCPEGSGCSNGYCHSNEPIICDLEDTPCDDGNQCTVNTYCVSGICQAGIPVNCGAEKVCDPTEGCIGINDDEIDIEEEEEEVVEEEEEVSVEPKEQAGDSNTF